MKKVWLIIFVIISGAISGFSQSETKQLNISEIKWELDYQIFLKLANDSAYQYDIRQLFHVAKSQPDEVPEYIYYPVNPGPEYISNLNNRPDSINLNPSYKTLWSALHASLKGDWVHFTNCLLYSLETNQLDLKAPLMKRPQTSWKPKPLTDSYLRTRKWKYYIPVKQKEAIKEYKIREERNELGDLKSIPEDFINLMITTSDKELNKLLEKGDRNQVAKIELVKLLLGVNFLGEAQINYIRSSVLNAVRNYSENKLPSVIVFDEFDAAAVMTLAPDGYKIDAIVFKKSADLSDADKQLQTSMIIGIIDKINSYNHNSFVKRLENYYMK